MFEEGRGRMYQFSRAIYRDLAPYVQGHGCNAHHAVLRSCETAVERLATDPHYFAHPSRSLFADIRRHFPMSEQARVWRVVSGYIGLAQEFMSRNPLAGHEVSGMPAQCRATTRKGTPCQRTPLPHNGYCPSHQHLAETENETPAALVA